MTQKYVEQIKLGQWKWDQKEGMFEETHAWWNL